jgi:hypothetical protein
MRCFHLSPLLVLVSLIISGCGGSTQTPSSPSGTLTGNWEIGLFPNNSSQTAPEIGGYITNTNNAVSGTLLMQGLTCTSSIVTLPISGTITPEGNISFAGTSSEGLTLSAAGVIEYPPSPVPGIWYPLSGAYTLSGCAGSQSGSIEGLSEAVLRAGTYTGTFQSASGNSFGVSMPIVQSGPDADGEYTLTSGTVAFTGSQCFSTGTITSSNVFGGNVDVTVSLNNNGTLEITGAHAPLPTFIIPVISYRVTGGTCGSDTGSGVLTWTAS